MHLAAASTVVVLIALGRGAPERIEIEVIEKPVQSAAASLDLAKSPPRPKPQPKEPARKVFGVTRKALTAGEAAEPNGVQVKQGNTVAAAPDDLKLAPSDAESLPIPADEFLITKMPSVVSDVRIPYPAEAKAKKIEGKVVLELLIDGSGQVRDVRLVSGPGYGLNEAAVEAIRRFRFQPAEIEGKPVAVRIPFTYNFVLQSE